VDKKNFKILAPFATLSDVEALKKAGADELYCGFVPEYLTDKWPLAFNLLNRRGEGQSFTDDDKFIVAVNEAREQGLPVYITLNGLYTQEQYPFLMDIIEKVECVDGVSGIIVADIGLLLLLRKKGFNKEIHISTGGTCFNSRTADYFSELGAKRIVLPRQLTSGEITSIISGSAKDIDIEIFIFAEGCGGYIDGFCTFLHCIEKSGKIALKNDLDIYRSFGYGYEGTGCTYLKNKLSDRQFQTFEVKTENEINVDLDYDAAQQAMFGCRLCDLYDLKQWPIKALKIVGRGKNIQLLVKHVEIVRKSRELLMDPSISSKSYKIQVQQLFNELTGSNNKRCSGNDCYFPEQYS
jgi:U32 family peptidase